MVRVQDIKLTLDEEEESIPSKISKKLKINPKEILEYKIFKKAIDARKKTAIKWVYTIDVKLAHPEQILKKHPELKVAEETTYTNVEKGIVPLKHRPVVVGAGPCGLFATLLLAQMGYQPILIERGKCVEERVQDVEAFWKSGEFNSNSNVQFGEGGAGTFSDGKLTTQIKNKRCRKVLEELVLSGAPEEILYQNKPHVGTDLLRNVIQNMRQRIQSLGGDIRFETQLTNFKVEEGKLRAIELNHDLWLETEVCVLAIGHSARDTFKLLKDTGLDLRQKAFAMGMRIEHLQDWINEAQYGVFKNHKKLGAADYKLVHHAENGRTVYSFCMCPGGYVIASASEEGGVVTNGMSEHGRDALNANSALLVNVKPEDFKSEDPLAGVALQRELEKLAYQLGNETYKAPVQKVGDFINNQTTTEIGIVKPTYTPGVVGTNFREHLPKFMEEALLEGIQAFGKKIKYFDHPDALFTGFETRSSSPIRIQRNEEGQSNIEGIYPAGEGAGYAGGITSAAVDGLSIAEMIIQKYKEVE